MHTEHRLVNELVKHWRRWKGPNPLPQYEAFAPEALEGDVWQKCCVFAIITSGAKRLYIADFIGDNAQEAVGRSLSGEVLSSGKAYGQAARLLEKADDVVRRHEPLIDEGHFVNDAAKIVKFRSCLLPFGRDAAPTHLMLGLSWRTF